MDADILTLMEIIIVGLLGLVLGSFATALIWRVPRYIPWVTGRSQCPHCHHILTVRDLVPVFSLLIRHGRCRYCSEKAGNRYMVVELTALLACLAVYASWGFTVQAFIIMTVVPILLALWVIDLDFMILPDQLVWIAGALAILFIGAAGWTSGSALVEKQMLSAIAGLAGYVFIAWFTGFIMTYVLKKQALGFGDVKFFAVAGLWLGISYLPFFLIFSGTAGVILGLYYLLVRKQRRFPFGPALIAALYAGLIMRGYDISLWGRPLTFLI